MSLAGMDGSAEHSAAQRAAALRPILERNRQAGERQRRLPDETLDALTDAGLFRAWVPRRFGGSEYELRTIIDSTAEVSRADPSAGWVTMILSCGDWLTGLFPDAAQDEVFGTSPDTRVCQVFTPHSAAVRTAGGWQVNGKWAPSSGCLHAQWAMLGLPLPEHDGRPSGRAFALVPMEQLRIEDTWFTTGMRATGSNLLIGDDVFVPDHRVLEVGPALEGRYPQKLNDSERFRAAVVPTLVAHMIAPFLGMASAALDYVVEQSAWRGVSFTSYRRQTDSTAFQIAVAEAAMKVDVARTIAHALASLVDSHARDGTHPGYQARARARMHAAHAIEQCREAVDILVSAHGASAFSESSPLQLYVRDIHTASRHAVAHPASNAEIFGRALLGVEPNISDLI